MKLRRQTADTEQHSGRARAATLSGVLSSLLPRWRVLLLGFVCFVIALSTAAASVAFADQAEIDSLKAQIEDLEDQIADLDQDLEISIEAYNQLVVQLNELNITMTTLRQQKDVAENDYQYRLRLYEDRLCDLYKAGGRDEFLQMVLDASNAVDFIDRARLAAELADEDRRLVENFRASSDRLNAVIADIDQAKSRELTIRAQMADQQDYIEATIAARESKLATTNVELAEAIEAERLRKIEEQAKLQRALTAVLRKYGTYSGALPTTDNEILDQFVCTAAAYLGTPYVWGGERPSTGLDCSGYTQFVYKQHGVKLPHYSGYQATMGSAVEPADIRAGDLLAFGLPVHHVGIYVGQGLYIHAAGTGSDVRIGRLIDRSDVSAIRRFNLKARSGEPVFR